MTKQKNFTKKIITILYSLIFPLALHSAQAGTFDDIANIKSILEKRTPPIKVRSVQTTPLAGLYEVYSEGSIFYTDKTTNYFIVGGSMLDDSAKKNLTTERIKELTSIKFIDLPFQNAIEIKKGTGAYKFAIFTDPDCPYCKTLEKSLAKSQLNNYTAYVFLYPLKELHPDASSKAESIWCAKNKAEVWKNWMVNDSIPTKANCSNPLDKNTNLAEAIGVLGTPTIYLNNGQQTQNPQELADAIANATQAE